MHTRNLAITLATSAALAGSAFAQAGTNPDPPTSSASGDPSGNGNTTTGSTKHRKHRRDTNSTTSTSSASDQSAIKGTASSQSAGSDSADMNPRKSTSRASRTVPGSASQTSDDQQLSTQGSQNDDQSKDEARNPTTSTGAPPSSQGSHGTEGPKTPQSAADKPVRH